MTTCILPLCKRISLSVLLLLSLFVSVLGSNLDCSFLFNDTLIFLDANSTSLSESGELFDSGGPTQSYQNNEDFTLVIRPVSNPECIELFVEYFNLEVSGDELILLDGEGPQAIPIDTIGKAIDSVEGGSGKYYHASSGAMTIRFVSDNSINFEGFHAFWSSSTQSCPSPDLVSVQETNNFQELEALLASENIEVEILAINCAAPAIGTFTASDDTQLGMEDGIVLSTGLISEITNPSVFHASTDLAFPGDTDLTFLLDSVLSPEINDACSIEMEVTPKTNFLRFEYIFGSEEYPEYVNTNFNDLFAFFISGPGIVGNPLINNQKNIAVLPSNGNPMVSINSVNDQLNWEYYRDNMEGGICTFDGLTTGYLGSKTSLTAKSEVQACASYRLKWVIADRGDFKYDSGVFISKLAASTNSTHIESLALQPK